MTAKILVVDDEPDLTRLMGYALEANGYEVLTAETGAKVLNIVNTEHPDLVILDVMLPEINGIEVAKLLRDIPDMSDLPIIMLSARAQVPDKIKALQAGADEYITKPVDAEEMVARVQALLERTRRLRHAQSGKRGRVLGFFGAKGGVGTTTVALNVAAVLGEQEKSVSAVELRPCYGTFSQHTNRTPFENLRHLLELNPEQIDDRAVSKALVNLSYGPKLLFGPQQVNEFKEIEPEYATAIIRTLTRMVDYTIIDFPSIPSAASKAGIRECDFVALVVEREPACVASALVTLDLLKSWGVGEEFVGAIIVDRAVSAMGMQLNEIKEQLSCQIIGVVPSAPEAYMTALKLGTPLVLSQRKDSATEALIEIANRLDTGKVAALSVA